MGVYWRVIQRHPASLVFAQASSRAETTFFFLEEETSRLLCNFECGAHSTVGATFVRTMTRGIPELNKNLDTFLKTSHFVRLWSSQTYDASQNDCRKRFGPYWYFFGMLQSLSCVGRRVWPNFVLEARGRHVEPRFTPVESCAQRRHQKWPSIFFQFPAPPFGG